MARPMDVAAGADVGAFRAADAMLEVVVVGVVVGVVAGLADVVGVVVGLATNEVVRGGQVVVGGRCGVVREEAVDVRLLIEVEPAYSESGLQPMPISESAIPVGLTTHADSHLTKGARGRRA